MKNSRVLDRLARRDAFSRARESYLEKFANLQVSIDVEVTFADLPNPASCQPKDGKFLIQIDQKKLAKRANDQGFSHSKSVIPDHLSDLSSGYIDAFLQEGLLYHELGHVLFSDFEALQEVQGKVRMSERQQFHSLVNVFEDSTIEIFLRQFFDCGNQLLIKNQIFWNLYQEQNVSQPEEFEPLTQADLVARQLGQVNTGLLDDFDSKAKELAIEAFYDVIQEPDAMQRYLRLLDLYNNLRDQIESRKQQEKGIDEMQENDPDDSGRSDGQQQEAPDVDLSPEEDEDGEQDQSGDVPSDEDEDAEQDQPGGSSDEDGEEDEEEEDAPRPSVGSVDEIGEDEIEKMKSDTDPNPSSQSDGEAEEIEAELEIAGGAGSGSQKIVEVDPGNFKADQARLNRASRRSRHLSEVIEEHFTPTQGNGVNRDRSRGRFDSNRLIKAARGSPRCFKTEDQPEEPDFQVVIALDDSGSMAGPLMESAAEAAAAVTKAFEDAGGRVYLYRFGSNVRLCKTPSMPYDEIKDAAASAKTTGGTSLLPLLKKYPELAQGLDDSFLFVITDGKPRGTTLCKEELDSIDDPTACLQIKDDGEGFQENYNAFQVISEDPDEVRDATTSIVRRLVEQGGSSL